MKVKARICSQAILMFCAHAALATSATASLINADFETGDFTGWTPFVTENGVANAEVSQFDVNQDGSTSFAASFSTGWDEWDVDNAPRGGGISQEFQSASGELEVRMDAAAVVESSIPNLASVQAGEVSVFIDDALILNYAFGSVLNNTVVTANLWDTIQLDEGLHTLTIVFTRPFFPADVLRQSIDDISLSGSAVVPVPSALFLFLSSLLLIPLLRRSR